VAIAVLFYHPNLTLDAFDEVDRRMHDAIGGGEPAGLIHHSVSGEDGALTTFEIWNSEEEFAAFGAVLMPIVQELELEAGLPTIMPLHRLVQEARP